ncbi:MAG: sodium:solute symporter family transporter [Gemmatimonadales bacterium]
MIPIGRGPALLLAAALYGVGTAAIAIWASRRTRTAGDFFAAGRRIGPLTLALASMAATLSGFTFIGGPGLLVRSGFGALFIFLPVSITAALAAWLLGTRLRLLGEARGLVTIPEAVGARYRSRTAHGLAAVSLLVAVVGYLATNLLALGLVIDALFGTGIAVGIWIGAALVLAYSTVGGMLAGVYTDVFQGLVMAAASLLVFGQALEVGGGLAAIATTILERDPGFLAPWGTLTPLGALSLYFVFSVGILGQPHVLHKFYLLKDPLQLRWYPLAMTGVMLVTLLILFGVGLATKALMLRGDLPPLAHPDDATPEFLLRYATPALAGLLFAGVMAAIMSTVNSFLNIGAAALTRDLPAAFGRPFRNELRMGRLATLAIGILAALAAQSSGSLVALLGVFGWGLFAATLVPALAVGLNWAGGTRTGAIASMACGLGLTLGGELLGFFRIYSLPAGVTVSGVALVLSLLVYLGVSVAGRRRGRRADLPPDPDVQLVMES